MNKIFNKDFFNNAMSFTLKGKILKENEMLDYYCNKGVFNIDFSNFLFFYVFLNQETKDNFLQNIFNNGFMISISEFNNNFFKKKKLVQIIKFFSRFMQDYVYYDTVLKSIFSLSNSLKIKSIENFFNSSCAIISQYLEDYKVICSYIFLNYKKYFKEDFIVSFYNKKMKVSQLNEIIIENIKNQNDYFLNLRKIFKKLYNFIINDVYYFVFGISSILSEN